MKTVKGLGMKSIYEWISSLFGSHHMIGKIFRYGLVGILGTGLHFALLIILVEWGHLHPVISSAIGFIVVLVVSYILNRRWTFVSHPTSQMAFMKYTVVSVTGLILNTSLMYITVEWWQWPYLLGQLVVVFVVPPSNFLMNYFWTFQRGV